MIKTLLYAVTFSLTATVTIPAVYGNHITGAVKVPRIVSSVQFPQSKWKIVRHTFQLQIPEESKPLSQLTISVPTGLTVKNKISVSDQSGHQVDTNVLVNGNQLILAFPKPIAPGDELKIAMRDVKISGVTDAWLYKVYAKLVGINAELPIGFARFPVYIR